MPLWLLSLLSGAWKAAQGLFALVCRYPLQCALVGSLCLSGWLYMGKQDAIERGDALATRLVEQRAEFVKASEEARAKAIALNKATEIHYRSIAERADNEAQAALADVRARADAYARRMRLQAGCINPAAPAKDGTSQGGDRSGDDAEFLAVSRNDFDIMVENSRRLEQVNRWANGLIADKLAIPEVEFGR